MLSMADRELGDSGAAVRVVRAIIAYRYGCRASVVTWDSAGSIYARPIGITRL